MDSTQVRFHLERNTDVMWVDVYSTESDAEVEIVDVGEELGFPGQVHARVDMRRGLVLGIIIQNYSRFKRRMLWNYKMTSIDRGISLLMNSLRARLRIEHALSSR